MVGTGYVGISNAVLLAQRNQVVALDIDARKVEQINAKRSPIVDPEIEDYLATRPLIWSRQPTSLSRIRRRFCRGGDADRLRPRHHHFNTGSVEW